MSLNTDVPISFVNFVLYLLIKLNNSERISTFSFFKNGGTYIIKVSKPQNWTHLSKHV